MPPKRASLVAAAQSNNPRQPTPVVAIPAHRSAPTTDQPTAGTAGPSSVPMRQTGSGETIGSGSGSAPGSRAASVVSSAMGMRPSAGPSVLGASRGGGKLKFRPTIPARRSQIDGDVKPDAASLRASTPTVSSASRGRGAPRGRGRGAARGGAGGSGDASSKPQPSSVGVGVFGAGVGVARANGARSTPFIPPPVRRSPTTQNPEEYSDHSDREDVIDIDAVSTLGESAPTSLFRDRHGESGVRGEGSGKGKARKGKGRAGGEGRMEVDEEGPGVKTEPSSPGRRVVGLDRNGGVRPPVGWSGADGAKGGAEGVNEAQRVDLSESESEEEEEPRTGDFIQLDEGEDPSNKLYIFQFPHLFPNFLPSGSIDLTATAEDVKPDIKPTPTQLKAAGPGAPGKKSKSPPKPPPEGRIGTLVCTRKGRVKMVLGDGIVMDVTAGLDTRFLQQLVHVDPAAKALTSLGEVHRLYKVTPDIDRLLRELYLNGGKTPWEKEQEAGPGAGAGRGGQAGEARGVKMELD